MKVTLRLILFLAVGSLLFSCNTSDTKEGNTKDAEQTTDQQEQQQPAGTTYPSIPQPLAEKLFNECTFIDFIFNELPVSISQNERSSIQQMIGFLSTTPATIKPDCASAATVFFQKDGEDLAMANFYFEEGCYAFVFLENNQPKYGNLITEAGYNYFTKILSGIPKE